MSMYLSWLTWLTLKATVSFLLRQIGFAIFGATFNLFTRVGLP